jgi:hypothetical protein
MALGSCRLIRRCPFLDIAQSTIVCPIWECDMSWGPEKATRCLAGVLQGHRSCLGPIALLTYLQFNVIKWAKQRPGQNPIDVKSDEVIQI